MLLFSFLLMSENTFEEEKQKCQMILYYKIFLFRSLSLFFCLFLFFLSLFAGSCVCSGIVVPCPMSSVRCDDCWCGTNALYPLHQISCLLHSFWYGASATGWIGTMAINIKNQRCAPLVLGILLLILPFLPATNLFVTVGFVVAERVLYIPR